MKFVVVQFKFNRFQKKKEPWAHTAASEVRSNAMNVSAIAEGSLVRTKLRNCLAHASLWSWGPWAKSRARPAEITSSTIIWRCWWTLKYEISQKICFEVVHAVKFERCEAQRMNLENKFSSILAPFTFTVLLKLLSWWNIDSVFCKIEILWSSLANFDSVERALLV